MKTTAKILAAILGSLMAALVWWAYFSVPPFPETLMLLLATVAKFIASNQLPELMDVWALLGIWSYIVFAILVGFVGLKVVARGSPDKNSYHQFQRTPDGAAEQ
jgi:hypothetical protein